MKGRYQQGDLHRFVTVLREKGPAHVAVFAFNHLLAGPIAAYHRATDRGRVRFEGHDIPYFFHSHNHTWLNERMLEVPVINHLMSDFTGSGARILEVGNVLSHYRAVAHDIVDKYEQAPNVRNDDIVTFAPGCRYDLIVSISTLEHVGWDEEPRQPERLLQAVDNLRSLLSENGVMYITVPVGENPYLDECLRDGRLRFERQWNFKRVAPRRWEEVPWEAIRHARHHHPFRFGNAVVIARDVA